jgi:hypothetical protein
MAYEFYETLQFQSGFISGMLAGKPLNCLVNPSLPGSAPLAGVYQIQPPLEDVVFGQMAVMTLVGRSDGGGAQPTYKPWGKLEKYTPGFDPSWAMNKKYVGASASLFDKMVPGGVSSSLFEKFVPGGGSTSYVLSSRPIPGQNCLVVGSGFADLMDALQKSGGAIVRF